MRGRIRVLSSDSHSGVSTDVIDHLSDDTLAMDDVIRKCHKDMVNSGVLDDPGRILDVDSRAFNVVNVETDRIR